MKGALTLLMLLVWFLVIAVNAQAIDNECYNGCIKTKVAAYEQCNTDLAEKNKICLSDVAKCRKNAQEALQGCVKLTNIAARVACVKLETANYYSCPNSYNGCYSTYYNRYLGCLEDSRGKFNVCRNTCKNPEIPEFSTVAAAIALAGAGAGFVILRKRK